jgi:hypothetical protein
MILINDHPTESRDVSIEIPPDPADTAWNKLVKDPRRLGVVDQSVRGTTSSSGTTTLNDTMGPKSLHVYTTSTVQNLLDDSVE